MDRTELKYGECLVSAYRFFYIGRIWWSGRNFDASIWSQSQNGLCFRRTILAGDSLDKLVSRTIIDVEIAVDLFLNFLHECKIAGAMEIQSDLELHTIGTHYDGVVAIKDGEMRHDYKIKGGIARDPRHRLLVQTVKRYAPEFFPRH